MPPAVPGASFFAGVVARVRSLWRGLLKRHEVEAEMAEEFRHHLEMRTQDLVRQGIPPAEAERQARIEFGHIEAHKEAARASRGLRLFDQLGLSWLDVKLGARMLGKYPALSFVSVVGMAVAMAVGVGGFGLLHALVDATLPLDEGERIVAVQNADVRTLGTVERHSARDFLLWRASLHSVRDLSAFATDGAVLSLPGGGTRFIGLARMTPSGFRVARVAPVLGRTLLDDDERPGAPPVLVISGEEWRDRFGGDPEVVGRSVRLDGTPYTVVGVMPEGFRFPVNFRYWAPLHLDREALNSGPGPTIHMFGRLADGATIQTAQAELTAVGRPWDEDPETGRYLRPQVLSYTGAAIGMNSPQRVWAFRTGEFVLSLLLLVVAVNVAILIYARTVSRTGEIAVRTALGASRTRVVTQLFAEALVLSLLAAGVGLGVADIGFAWLRSFVRQGTIAELPFWLDLRIGPAVVAYAVALAVVAAVIVGVLPALKATGSSVQASLQQLAARGSRMHLGRAWTALITLQVALAVAALPFAISSSQHLVGSALKNPGYPVDEFVHATVSMDPAFATLSMAAGGNGAFAAGVAELVRATEADPKVAGVACAHYFPGGEVYHPIEVEGAGAPSAIWMNQVDARFFKVFDVPVLAGRGFNDGEVESVSHSVLVDQVFVQKVLSGGPALGRRIRLVGRTTGGDAGDPQEGPWLEIVGVVGAFTPPPAFEHAAPKVYTPLALAQAGARVELAVRMKHGADATAFVGPLRQVAHTTAPGLEVDPRTAAGDEHKRRQGLLMTALAVGLVVGSVLLLSAAGIYAMMSFTVASRRREIGIRSALGAGPRRLLTGIFARGTAQLVMGGAAGLLLDGLLSWPLGNGGWLWTKDGVLLQLLVATVMVAIGLVAVWVPARRGLAIQPTEALRGE